MCIASKVLEAVRGDRWFVPRLKWCMAEVLRDTARKTVMEAASATIMQDGSIQMAARALFLGFPQTFCSGRGQLGGVSVGGHQQQAVGRFFESLKDSGNCQTACC